MSHYGNPKGASTKAKSILDLDLIPTSYNPPPSANLEPIDCMDSQGLGIILADLLARSPGHPQWRADFHWWDDRTRLQSIQRRGFAKMRILIRWHGYEGMQFEERVPIDGMTSGGLAVAVAGAYQRFFQEAARRKSTDPDGRYSLGGPSRQHYNINTIYLLRIKHTAHDTVMADVAADKF